MFVVTADETGVTGNDLLGAEHIIEISDRVASDATLTGLGIPGDLLGIAVGAVTEPMLAMHNNPGNAQVIGWNQSDARMEWVDAATDQRIVELIDDHNPTATPGAVTQTGGGDMGSGPKFAWEDHTHQIVGIQFDDIPGTPITTVPDDAMLMVETAGGINRKITGANARTSLGGGGGVDLGTASQLATLDLADRILVADQSDSWANKYMTAETFAGIIRPEVFHGTTRIAAGPSALNFDSGHFVVTGDNDGVDIGLAGGVAPTVTIIDGDFALGVAQTTLGSGTAIEADKEIAISVYAKGGNRADAVGYWQGPSALLRETTTNGPIWIAVGANRRVEARVSNTTDYHFQIAVQSGQASMAGEWYVRVQERGPQGERGPAGTSGILDIDSLTVLSGNLANGDDLVVYDDSASAVRKVSMTAVWRLRLPHLGVYHHDRSARRCRLVVLRRRQQRRRHAARQRREPQDVHRRGLGTGLRELARGRAHPRPAGGIRPARQRHRPDERVGRAGVRDDRQHEDERE